ELNAHAFTSGNDVFFNAGGYDPASDSGYAVLAHELTHTLQQAAGPVAAAPLSADLAVSSPHDPDERDAYRTAERLTAPRHPRTGATAPDPATADRAGERPPAPAAPA